MNPFVSPYENDGWPFAKAIRCFGSLAEQQKAGKKISAFFSKFDTFFVKSFFQRLSAPVLCLGFVKTRPPFKIQTSPVFLRLSALRPPELSVRDSYAQLHQD